MSKGQNAEKATTRLKVGWPLKAISNSNDSTDFQSNNRTVLVQGHAQESDAQVCRSEQTSTKKTELQESNSQWKHCSHPLLTPPTILHELKFYPVGTVAPRKAEAQRFSSSVSQFYLSIFLSNPPICLIHPSSSAASCAHSSVCARGTMQASAHRNVTSDLSAARAVTATLQVFLQGSCNSPSHFTRN